MLNFNNWCKKHENISNTYVNKLLSDASPRTLSHKPVRDRLISPDVVRRGCGCPRIYSQCHFRSTLTLGESVDRSVFFRFTKKQGIIIFSVNGLNDTVLLCNCIKQLELKGLD